MRWALLRRENSVARQVLLLQVVVVVLVVSAALALAAYDARRDARSSATAQAVAVAQTVADTPSVMAAVGTPDASATLQPFAEQVRADSDVDFITIMDLDRTRLTHPDPGNIGKPFIGDLGAAPAGEVFTQEYAGTLGPSMRAVVPVVDEDENVVALVAVGITVDRIDQGLRQDLALILGAGVALLSLGLLAAWLINRRLRRQTHGLGEQEITRMYEYYQAILHAVREGLLLLDANGRVELANDEARRLLDLPHDVVGKPLSELGLPPGLVDAAVTGVSEADNIFVAGEHVLMVSIAPAEGGLGVVITLRDHTELRSVTGELATVRNLTESLRSINHESANRLHTVVALMEMGRPEDAVAFATDELRIAQDLTDRVVGAVGDPVAAAILLGKSSEAAERGVELTIAGEVPESISISRRDLVTVLGNLIDNALDAVNGLTERRVSVSFHDVGDSLEIVVGDSGPGLEGVDVESVLSRGWTTKTSAAEDGGRGVGLALVAQVARQHGGSVTIGSSPLGGAQFAVSIRRQPSPAGSL